MWENKFKRLDWTFFVRMMALRQKIGQRPRFKKVASKGKTTTYKFDKFTINAETTSMMQVEKETNAKVPVWIGNIGQLAVFGMSAGREGRL